MEKPGLVTTAEAAERLGVSWERARQLAATGRFPGAFQLGRAWAIPAASVENFRRQPHGVRLGRRPRKAARGDAPTEAPSEQPAPTPREG